MKGNIQTVKQDYHYLNSDEVDIEKELVAYNNMVNYQLRKLHRLDIDESVVTSNVIRLLHMCDVPLKNLKMVYWHDMQDMGGEQHVYVRFTDNTACEIVVGCSLSIKYRMVERYSIDDNMCVNCNVDRVIRGSFIVHY